MIPNIYLVLRLLNIDLRRSIFSRDLNCCIPHSLYLLTENSYNFDESEISVSDTIVRVYPADH